MVHDLGIEISPLVGFCCPDKILSKVLLPAPFLPAKPILSLGFIKKEILSKRLYPPKLTVTPLTEIIIFQKIIKR